MGTSAAINASMRPASRLMVPNRSFMVVSMLFEREEEGEEGEEGGEERRGEKYRSKSRIKRINDDGCTQEHDYKVGEGGEGGGVHTVPCLPSGRSRRG